MQVNLIGDSKLPVAVNVSMSIVCLCASPVMTWQPVVLHSVSWDWPPANL